MGKKVKKEVEAPPKDIFDPLNIESKKTGTVVLMLKSEEEEVLAKAAEAIYRYADKCDDNKAMLLELGAMESLLNLINHEEKSVKRFACMAFGTMAGHPIVRKYLRKTDAIGSAIQLLGDEDDVCNEFSSLFLAHMATDYSSKMAIGTADGLEPLINLLASPDPDIQKNSLSAICLLVEDFHSRTIVRDLGGIPALIELINSEYAIIQELTLKTLTSLTQDAESRALVRENEGLERLVEFLENKALEDLHVNAIAVLSNCFIDTEALDEIRNTEGLARLLAFITESEAPPHVQATAARALGRAAKNDENAKILHEAEVGKALITLIQMESEEVQIAACQAIATLSNNLAAKDAFGRSEGITPLVALTAVESFAVQEAACVAVANLTLNNTNNCNEVLAAGGVEYMLALLNSEKDLIVINSLTAFLNMSKDISLRLDIFRRGIISALIQPLKSANPKVQTKVAQVVATYVNGADSRAEIRDQGGLEPLLNYMRSNDSDVRMNAALALVQCVADPTTASQISKLGGLELLQKVNSSDQLKSNSSVNAFNQLLDFNLSAKYSLCGGLANHNVVEERFYDAGQLRPESEFLSLEQLVQKEVDSSRPILLVNCKADPVRITSDDTSEKSSRVSSKASHSRRKKRDKEAAAAAEAERLRLEKEGDAYRPPMDSQLLTYIEEVKKHILPIPNTQEQIVALAQYVSERMGGAVPKDKLLEFPWQLHIAELKHELKSNIIPIGKIKSGIHIHRALLYKVLADKVGLPCTLVRGEYNRAWNEVRFAAANDGNQPNYPPSLYIVDLMHDPGSLLRNDSPEAVLYQSI